MSQWKLSKPEYDILLSYVGCGNFPGADIIVFGNEEGTGGYSVEANVKARVHLHGKDHPDEKRKYCIHGTDWRQGFYEPSSKGGASKVEQYLLSHESVQEKGFAKGAFNPAVARICLDLEDRSNTTNWYQSGKENPDAWESIKSFVVGDLYEPRDGIQTALADWRPVPRKNESAWDRNEYGNLAASLKKNPYLDAFNHPTKPFKPNKYMQPLFSHFHDDMVQRSKILKSLFIASKANIILCLGGANAKSYKKQALEIMFGPEIFEPMRFKMADMRTRGGGALEAFKAVVPLEHKTLHIFMVPFPSWGNVFKSQQDALNMLKELTSNYIKPCLA